MRRGWGRGKNWTPKGGGKYAWFGTYWGRKRSNKSAQIGIGKLDEVTNVRYVGEANEVNIGVMLETKKRNEE